MNRLIILAAVAAIAATACTKTFEVEPTAEAPIGFGTWTEHLTKAEARVQGSNDFLAGDTFAVYGAKTDTDPEPDVTTTIFNGDVVEASGSGTLTWDYNNHRYWDSSAELYTFYAVSPSGVKDVSGASINAQTGEITTGSTVFAGNNNDILVADKTDVAKGSGASSTYFSSYATVNMMFNHAASLVDVKVKKAPTLTAAVGISSISLDNIFNTGVLHVVNYNKVVDANRTTVPNLTIASWTSSNPVSYLPTAGVTPVYGDASTNAAIAADNQKIIAADSGFAADNTTANTTPGASTTLFDHLVVVPQTFGASGNTASQKITISYTLGTDPTTYTRTLYLADFDTVDNSDQTNDAKFATGWEPGKHYTLYITIDAHEIMFSAEIDPWTPVNGYHYLLN